MSKPDNQELKEKMSIPQIIKNVKYVLSYAVKLDKLYVISHFTLVSILLLQHLYIKQNVFIVLDPLLSCNRQKVSGWIISLKKPRRAPEPAPPPPPPYLDQ